MHNQRLCNSNPQRSEEKSDKIIIMVQNISQLKILGYGYSAKCESAKMRNGKLRTNCETQRDWFIFLSRDRRISHFTIIGVSQLAT